MANLSDLENLPTELLVQVVTQLSTRDLARLCQSSQRMSELCRDNGFWSGRAFHDFGYPYQAFDVLLPSDWTPTQRYAYIKDSMIPSADHLKILNEMALLWSVKPGIWDPRPDVFTNIDFLKSYNLGQPLNQEQARKLSQFLTSQLNTQFIPFVHLYLQGLYINHIFRNINNQFQQLSIPYHSTTLIHDPKIPRINYIQVLQATSILVPPLGSNRVFQYEFDGFSDEGYPTLKVTFQS